MSWPKKTWVNGEWVDFKTPGIGPPKGFPDDWKKYKSSVDNSSYWDILDNPLYEAAANAKGLNWEEWKTDAMASIGDEDEYGSNEYVRVQTSAGGRRRTGRTGFTEVEPTYDVMTRQEAYDEGYTDEDIAAGGGVSRGDDDDIDWGIDRGKFGSIAEDLDDMHGWLGKTIKTHSLQDSDIITHGLDGSDYGIDGDLWAHYGLDKPPRPPKPMELAYNFNLLGAKPSTATYATPAGFPVIDKSTESVAYGDTHYAKWQAEQDKAYENWEAEHGDTSYGETA